MRCTGAMGGLDNPSAKRPCDAIELLQIVSHTKDLCFVNIVEILMTQRFDIAIDPLDAIIETLVESDPIVPTKSVADFCAIKHIGCVLAGPVTYDFNGRVETSAYLGANPFD